MILSADDIERSVFIFGVISGVVVGIALLLIAFDQWMNR